MPYIPPGSYRFPLGILLVSESDIFSAMIRIVPRSNTIPDPVKEFTLFWKGEGYDGSEVGFGEGLSEEELQDLPPEYRYEDYDLEDEDEC